MLGTGTCPTWQVIVGFSTGAGINYGTPICSTSPGGVSGWSSGQLLVSDGTTGIWKDTGSIDVGNADKVDGLHANELVAAGTSGGGETKTFRLVQKYDLWDTFTVWSLTCKKLGTHWNADGSTWNYYYNNEAKAVQAIAGAGCQDWLYSWSYGTSNMIYCQGWGVYDYLCSN